MRAAPNPTTGEVRLYFGSRPHEWTVTILDATGRQVHTEPATRAAEAVIDLPGAAGLYTVLATNEEGTTQRVRVVKRP